MKTKLILKFANGNFEEGFPGSTIEVQQITEDGEKSKSIFNCDLSPAPEMPLTYKNWQLQFRGLVGAEDPKSGFKDTLTQAAYRDCKTCYEVLDEQSNGWLNNLPIIEQLENILKSQLKSDEQTLLLEVNTEQVAADSTTKYLLHQLRFESWKLLESYQVESYLKTHQVNSSSDPIKFERLSKSVKVLGIVGDDTGIDLKEDKKLIQNLSHRGASPTFLPDGEKSFLTREDLKAFWDEPWDVLVFSGHSDTRLEGKTGVIYLNKDEYLNFQEIKKTLKEAKRWGLKLAIFNSCDGLGLAEQLKDLGITVVVWREPVPCKTASLFLKNFLEEFTNKADESICRALQSAKSRLKEVENNNPEKEHPGVTDLPVVIHNGSEEPPTWNQLRPKVSKFKTEKKSLLTISDKRKERDGLREEIKQLKREAEVLEKIGEKPSQELLEAIAVKELLEQEHDKDIKQKLPQELPLPRERYANLLGREKPIGDIMNALQASKGHPVIAIDGFGGVGKTALTREIVERSKNDSNFYYPIWQSASLKTCTAGGISNERNTSVNFPKIMSDIARGLDYRKFSDLNDEEEMRKQFRKIINYENYLIVIDNLETVRESVELVNHLESLFDERSCSKVIITTRKSVPPGCRHVRSFKLRGLEREDSLKFLRAYAAERQDANDVISNADEDKLVTIHQRTDGNPLAMEFIVGQLEGGLSINTILEKLKIVNANNCNDDESIYHQFYEFILWDSWNQLPKSAQELLIHIGIPPVMAGIKINDLISNTGLTLSEIEDAKSHLMKWSLLKLEGKEEQQTFLLHPFTHSFVQELC